MDEVFGVFISSGTVIRDGGSTAPLLVPILPTLLNGGEKISLPTATPFHEKGRVTSNTTTLIPA